MLYFTVGLVLFGVLVSALGAYLFTSAIIPGVMILTSLAVLVGFVFYRYYLRHWPRWWLLQNGVESGPFSLQTFGDMRSKFPPSNDQVRFNGSTTWHPFTLLVIGPPRLRAAFFGLVLGFLAGWALASATMAHVPGYGYVQIDTQPTKSMARQAIEATVRIGAAGANKSRIPGVAEIGGAAHEGYKMLDENSLYTEISQAVLRMRITTAGMALLVAALCAYCARPSYQLVLGRRIADPIPAPAPPSAKKSPLNPPAQRQPRSEAVTFEPVRNPRRPGPGQK